MKITIYSWKMGTICSMRQIAEDILRIYYSVGLYVTEQIQLQLMNGLLKLQNLELKALEFEKNSFFAFINDY